MRSHLLAHDFVGPQHRIVRRGHAAVGKLNAHVLRFHLERACPFVEFHRALARDHVIRLGLTNQRLKALGRVERLRLLCRSMLSTCEKRSLEARSGHGSGWTISIHDFPSLRSVDRVVRSILAAMPFRFDLGFIGVPQSYRLRGFLRRLLRPLLHVIKGPHCKRTERGQ